LELAMTVRHAAVCFALLAAAPLAFACDISADVAALRLAADRADEQLVDQRTAVWLQLSATQKAEFARRERAWLNGGRDEQVQACAGTAADAQTLQQCRLQVIEAHRSALAMPLMQASAAR
jgi:hypothetical protein